MHGRTPFALAAAFAVFLVAGLLLAFVSPDDRGPGPALVAYYEDTDRAVRVALGSVMVIGAAGLLLALQGWINGQLEGASRGLIELSSRAATVAASTMVTAAGTWSVTVWSNLYYEPLSSETIKVL